MVLNVGGSVHQVKWETIEKFPKSRLHSLRYASTEGGYLGTWVLGSQWYLKKFHPKVCNHGEGPY